MRTNISFFEFGFEKRELVSAVIGSDLQRRGIYAVAASLAAIAVFIGVRFRFAFAAGAIAATVHDVLVTLAFVALAGYDLSLNVVAALLTIIGYSVNDTIVIFDRVRENAKRMSAEALYAVVNLSVNQTLARTVITAGTTLLSVLALYVFGGEALRGFAFTMLVGIVAGTYSTVFIASATAILLTGAQASRGRSRSAAPRNLWTWRVLQTLSTPSETFIGPVASSFPIRGTSEARACWRNLDFLPWPPRVRDWRGRWDNPTTTCHSMRRSVIFMRSLRV